MIYSGNNRLLLIIKILTPARVDALTYTTSLPALAAGTYKFTVIPVDGNKVDVSSKKVSQTFNI